MRHLLLKACCFSFLVYLLPVVSMHGSAPWGALLFFELTDGVRERGAGWVATDVVLAATLQVAAGWLAYWFFQRAGWRRLLATAAAVPVLWVAMMWGYVEAIPRYFLVDAGRSPEIGDWREECRVANAYLSDVRTPADLSLEKAGHALIAMSPESDLGVLRTPGCEVKDLGVRWSNASPRIYSVARTGAILYGVHDRAADEWSWWVASGGGADPISLVRPAHTRNSGPILSTDGEWVAWLQRLPVRDPVRDKETRPVVWVESVRSGNTLTVDLQDFAPASFRLDHFDHEAGELVLTRNEEEFIGVGLDRDLRWGPWNPEGVKAWAGTRRSLESGWLVWDAYRDSEPYRLKWSLHGADGSSTVRRGYSIRSAAVDPGGRFIAVSVGGRYSFAMPDAVYVFRASDGEEGFRRSLPRHSRSRVVFLGSEFFAYTGGKDVRVLRMDGN